MFEAIVLCLVATALMSYVNARFVGLPPTIGVMAIALLISLSLVVLLCFSTNARNDLYRDAVLLWSDAVEKSPGKARPHNNLGHAYALRDEWDLAIEEFRMALTLQPAYPLAQQNLLNAYLRHVDRD